MKYSLHILKQGKMFCLLSSEEKLVNDDNQALKKSCLSFDTYFKIVHANSAVFEVDKDADNFIDDSDEAAFEKAFSKKKYVNVVICTSH